MRNTSTASLITSELLNVSIFPNPATNILKIQLPNLVDSASIILYSVKGQKIKEVVGISKNAAIDLSNLSKGIYFISIETEKLSKSYKIIKQ